MDWSDFFEKTALDCDMLERALPLLPTQGTGEDAIAIDPASAGPHQRQLNRHDISGATPEACIDILAIRPLLVGTAWKIMDLIVETACTQTPGGPAAGTHQRIDEKVSAMASDDRDRYRPAAISQPAWAGLALTYARTVELRHSLVHRKVSVTPSGELIGHDKRGTPTHSMTVEEQEALGRAVLRAVQLLNTERGDQRQQNDLLRHLLRLGNIHGLDLPHVPARQALLTTITYIADLAPDDSGRYLVDVPYLWDNSPFPEGSEIDLIVRPRQRPGYELRGRLEEAPRTIELVDLAAPPAWLS